MGSNPHDQQYLPMLHMPLMSMSRVLLSQSTFMHSAYLVRFQLSSISFSLLGGLLSCSGFSTFGRRELLFLAFASFEFCSASCRICFVELAACCRSLLICALYFAICSCILAFMSTIPLLVWLTCCRNSWSWTSSLSCWRC